KYADRHLDAVVAEVNQGGDFIETTLRSQADGTAFTYCPVRATQGKLLRAEPVAAAYERGLVHHVGYFPELEDQLLEWTPSDRRSPDRMDALVWGITYLIRAGDAAYGDLPDYPCISDHAAGCFLGRELGFNPDRPFGGMFKPDRFPPPPRFP
ncbi:MAG TPA: hypothetical protein O0X27_06735, partial [Methanocorpusculum sp.]|nr:hypothetical protein [Methanocorpusculum sp.]